MRERLESKLGPLAFLEIERVPAKDSALAQAMFARTGRQISAWIERFNRAADGAEAAD